MPPASFDDQSPFFGADRATRDAAGLDGELPDGDFVVADSPQARWAVRDRPLWHSALDSAIILFAFFGAGIAVGLIDIYARQLLDDMRDNNPAAEQRGAEDHQAHPGIAGPICPDCLEDLANAR